MMFKKSNSSTSRMIQMIEIPKTRSLNSKNNQVLLRYMKSRRKSNRRITPFQRIPEYDQAMDSAKIEIFCGTLGIITSGLFIATAVSCVGASAPLLLPIIIFSGITALLFSVILGNGINNLIGSIKKSSSDFNSENNTDCNKITTVENKKITTFFQPSKNEISSIDDVFMNTCLPVNV